MTDTASRDALVQRLASLLGFEDGASDVLNHLLSIESETDLRDYLSQLLGQENDSVREFVKDVGRFHEGETILPAQDDAEELDDRKPAAKEASVKKPQPVWPEPLPPAKQNPALVGRKKRGKNRSRTPPRKDLTKRLPTPTNANYKNNKQSARNATAEDETSPKSKAPGADSSMSQAVETKELKPPETVPPPAPPKKAPPPPRGKATVVCGCFGTKHKCLTNCLYCGRISCEREGYSYCPFCGFLVQEFKATRPPPTEDGASDSDKKKLAAWEHKERLLQFDRDFARRTVILDDQADYFSSKTSSWLTDKEKDNAAEVDNHQRKQMHERKKQQLDIAF